MKNNRALISNILFQEDEGPRQDTAIASLNKLKPVFSVNGTVTAGNSSQMSDGAGLVLLANEDMVKAFDLKPIGRFVDYAVKGVQPELMGIGPVESIPYTLKRAGLQLDEIDIIELNEAFAAQALAVINTLKLPDEKINRQGGAIALGHPLGATGAIRTATLMAMLKREKMRYGMVTMCIGTGMGATGLFECF
jgi:acetyl-CoA acyltransferase